MITKTENPLPEVMLTDRAAQVFKEACEAEGSSLEDTFLRIGARPGGCSGWKYELESSKLEEVGPNDVQIRSRNVSVVVDRVALTDILGPLKIDFSDKNLVEQGFVFEQLQTGHQCGCGESFTPVKDLKSSKNNAPIS
jgi:iron-sulfur cluster assembly protein